MQEENNDFSDDEEGQPKAKEANTAARKRNLKFTDTDGEKTLEPAEKIDLAKYDVMHMVDPLFKQTTQKFDDLTIGNLMGASLGINSDLMLMLDSEMVKSSSKRNQDDFQEIAEKDGEYKSILDGALSKISDFFTENKINLDQDPILKNSNIS